MENYLNKIIQGDCLGIMKEMEDNSVDAIVTDPPAGISFMGKEWDTDKGGRDNWVAWMQEIAIECKRVLKPGGHALVWSIPRTSHWTAYAWENAGFEVRDNIAHVFGSGFPKSLNVGKQINKLETDEWSKISNAIDKIDKKSIIEVWKNNVSLVVEPLEKKITEVGNNTQKNFFVPDTAVLLIRQENNDVSVTTAEMYYGDPNLLSEENLIIAVGNAEQSIELLPNFARFAEKLPQNQNLKPLNIFTAECDVKEWLKENTTVNHRVDEVLKTLRGNKKYSNEDITNVLCVVITEILKHTILNQSKTFQSLDTKSQMECVFAINAIITEYTAENLILNTVNILKSKAVDKLQGNEREYISESPFKASDKAERASAGKSQSGRTTHPPITKGTSEWEGWGTALKPAREDWWLLRKPLEKGLTVAENCLKWGTGGINIDGSRIPANWKEERPESWFNSGTSKSGEATYGGNLKTLTKTTVGDRLNNAGRFPANLIHDNSEEVRGCFPETKSGKLKSDCYKKDRKNDSMFAGGENFTHKGYDADSGNASRFFKSIIYQAKASKSERNRGCEGLEDKEEVYPGINTFDENGNRLRADGSIIPPLKSKNNHPTVKPIALMEYLVKLVSREGAVVLDPFAGSGTTGVACKNLNRNYILIEKEPEYIPIIEARLNIDKQPNLF